MPGRAKAPRQDAGPNRRSPERTDSMTTRWRRYSRAAVRPVEYRRHRHVRRQAELRGGRGDCGWPQCAYRGEMTRMTENYPPTSTPSRRGRPSPPQPAKEMGTADVVQDQAADLSHSSVQAGKHVADVGREQASGVAAEAGRQGG